MSKAGEKLAEAIHEYCVSCEAAGAKSPEEEAKRVEECHYTGCPLWEYRMGDTG